MERAAAAQGAVLAPTVQPTGFAMVKVLVESFKNGYPGDVIEEWRGIYGNTFTLMLPLESRVMSFQHLQKRTYSICLDSDIRA